MGPKMTGRVDATVVLKSVSEGNSDAVAELLPLVYEELRRLAASYLARERADHTLQIPRCLGQDSGIHECQTVSIELEPAADGRPYVGDGARTGVEDVHHGVDTVAVAVEVRAALGRLGNREVAVDRQT